MSAVAELKSPFHTQRRVGHAEAREIAQRLINSHFQQEPRARMSIPANIERDDDLLICAYIAQQDRQQKIADALLVALSALAEDQDTARWQNAPHDLLKSARAAIAAAVA